MTITLVDSHCHLNYDDFKDDFGDVLVRAKNAGVETLLTINTKISQAADLVKIAEAYPQIWASIGVHPHEVESEGVPTPDQLTILTQHPKVVGLGETGLDYYYEHSPKNLQQESFRNHIRVAKEIGLPLIIHSRMAEDDILKILDEEKIQEMQKPGVIHCFSGTRKFAEETMKRGFYISISGIVTFKKADELRDIIKDVPLGHLLIETDAPYLAPIPMRGKRNEPAYVVHTAQAIADIKNISLNELAQATSQNFFDLFKKVKSSNNILS